MGKLSCGVVRTRRGHPIMTRSSYRLAHLPVQPVLELQDSPCGIPLPVVL